MARQANARKSQTSDPVRNFRFLVKFIPLTPNGGSSDFKPVATVGFTSISGLSMTTEPIPYREGGYNTTVHQIPGQTTFSPVTFQRGVTIGTRQNYDWTRMLFRSISGGGPSDRLTANRSSFRANIQIDVLNHPVPYSTSTDFGADGIGETSIAGDDLVVARFNLFNTWPTSLAYSDLNAGDNALVVEQMTVVHEGLSMSWASESAVEQGITDVTNEA